MRYVVALLLVFVSAVALALPPVGQPFPGLSAPDLEGQPRQVQDLLGPDRTLVVAIHDRHAGDAMRAWYDRADAEAPKEIGRISIISLKLPFYVSEGTARGKAQDQVPRRWWHATLLDTDGKMAKHL